MIVLIAGASHTGKTLLAQRLLEKYHYPYLSIDHLKMGLIRAGQTTLTPESSDAALTTSLWPILRGIIKTALENRQNLILEGCYIPFDWAKDFTPAERKEIRYCCLVMTERYIRTHFADILRHANVIEKRLDDSGCTQSGLLRENADVLVACRLYGVKPLLIDESYEVDLQL